MNSQLAQAHFASRREWFDKFRRSAWTANERAKSATPYYCDLCATVIAGHPSVPPVEHRTYASDNADVCATCWNVWSNLVDAKQEDYQDLLKTVESSGKKSAQSLDDVEPGKRCINCRTTAANVIPNALHDGRDWRGEFCGTCYATHYCLCAPKIEKAQELYVMADEILNLAPTEFWNLTEEDAEKIANQLFED